jgi:hypothetical protein
LRTAVASRHDHTQRTLRRHARTHATLVQPYPDAHTGPDARADDRSNGQFNDGKPNVR